MKNSCDLVPKDSNRFHQMQRDRPDAPTLILAVPLDCNPRCRRSDARFRMDGLLVAKALQCLGGLSVAGRRQSGDLLQRFGWPLNDNPSAFGGFRHEISCSLLIDFDQLTFDQDHCVGTEQVGQRILSRLHRQPGRRANFEITAGYLIDSCQHVPGCEPTRKYDGAAKLGLERRYLCSFELKVESKIAFLAILFV